ncbi:MAG: IPT/TIG domain-containing protein [Betaproteobacteria bacterium]|nr:IPT/TIG domain-containing protein [Betaproteobacteria bacterium]
MRWWTTLAVGIWVGALQTLVPIPAHAVPVLVNGASCPSATLKFSASGMIANLPAGCSSNGNPCEGASAILSQDGIAITAPAACLTSGPTPSAAIVRTVRLNGVSCANATAILSANNLFLDAPAGCQAISLLEPEPVNVGTSGDRVVTFSGRACSAGIVTFSEDTMTLTAPRACLSATPVPVIALISPVSAYAGQSITITGVDFAASSTVTIGGVAATVETATTTSITVRVPAVATGAQPVVVKANGQTSLPVEMLIVAAPPMMELLSVQSRKTHGSAGTHAIDIDTATDVDGPVTVEPRARGAGHLIVFRFDGTITSPGTISVEDSLGNGITFQSSFTGQELSIELPDVADNKRVLISLDGVNGSTQAVAAIGFLMGDVNGSRAVNAADVTAIKARGGQVVDSSNFLFDINASGSITAADILAVRRRVGVSLP